MITYKLYLINVDKNVYEWGIFIVAIWIVVCCFLFIFSMLQVQELGYESIHTNNQCGRDSQGNTL